MSVKRALLVLVLATALVAGACGAQDSSSGKDPESESSTTTSGDTGGTASNASFGDLKGDICGPGEFSVNPSEAGLGTD